MPTYLTNEVVCDNDYMEYINTLLVQTQQTSSFTSMHINFEETKNCSVESKIKSLSNRFEERKKHHGTT